eukprot:scaffold254630_cov21-Prasinocladus_malaysianus.AAC.1
MMYTFFDQSLSEIAHWLCDDLKADKCLTMCQICLHLFVGFYRLDWALIAKSFANFRATEIFDAKRLRYH